MIKAGNSDCVLITAIYAEHNTICIKLLAREYLKNQYLPTAYIPVCFTMNWCENQMLIYNWRTNSVGLKNTRAKLRLDQADYLLRITATTHREKCQFPRARQWLTPNQRPTVCRHWRMLTKLHFFEVVTQPRIGKHTGQFYA